MTDLCSSDHDGIVKYACKFLTFVAMRIVKAQFRAQNELKTTVLYKTICFVKEYQISRGNIKEHFLPNFPLFY